MKRKLLVPAVMVLAFMLMIGSAHAAGKKGLLVYDSIYGSTVEVAYWIKAIIGHEQHLDVKSIAQVLTIEPYDYVILSSATRNEGPTKSMHSFIEEHRSVLAKKELCFVLVCGDSDETQVLKVPGRAAHLIAGRNYLLPVYERYPELQFTCIAGVGGRQVMPTLGRFDALQIWLLERLAREGAHWAGLDIWESLVVERVEAFANEVRVKVLGLEPRENVEQFRGYWKSLQPASLTDSSKKKYVPKPWTEKVNTDKIYYSRSRITGDIDQAIALIETWAGTHGIDLQVQVETFYNRYYHAVKEYDGREVVIHIVPSTMPEDPGTVHVSFRCYERPARRAGAEKDIAAAEKLLWADGRKIE